MVGDIGFEPMASSMSPRHSTPELIAQSLNYNRYKYHNIIRKNIIIIHKIENTCK